MDNIPQTFLSEVSSIFGATSSGLSGSKIVNFFVKHASNFDVDIPHCSYPFDAANKKTALLENLMVFQPEQQFKIIRELCDHPDLPKEAKQDAENKKIQLIARYGKFFGTESETTLNQVLVEEVKSFLSDFKKSEKLYNDALTKFDNNVFERNLLDDLRLSLELLLKDIFSNDKSLENQISAIGQLINSKGGSCHFTNMFNKLVDYYTKYQNIFVKHNDAVIEEEIEFIFEITSSFMKHLIKINYKKV